MWQILLGAAVAGSTGLLAKHLFNPNNPISQGNPNSDNDQEKLDLQFQNGFLESGCESNGEDKGKQDGIFRFSSSESAGKTGLKTKDRNLRKKVVLKKAEKRSSGADGVEVSRRKFAVWSKKRRTGMNVAYKCGSRPSKDGSVFRWGLGFGIMYMMSAGKAEINRLNSTMDETAKVVQELKTELCKRKSSCNVQASNSANEVATGSKKSSGKNTQVLLDKSGTGNRDHNEIKVCSVPVIDDGEYASSVLTEEPEPEVEVGEMDQLEAELESELQKLSETEVSAKSLHESVGQRSDSYQCQGVLPSELDQKLCHLLIEQQENQIEELESELSLAQSKLREKEAELQALKDCVRGLANFSLSTVSDDNETQGEQASMNDQDCPIKSGLETRKSLVGMKRPIES
ncbi:uncharacterized protein LOC110420883 [Herrania umbratica]|uniref:Uncharacterized protein LOC110420883 n=1 Tax=Herrania umbratica TaxID=108875 RepID=A0A6J1ASJ1_9ROSI|nr:uncharacterized protein LOC110420883 [Herrania umbratica]